MGKGKGQIRDHALKAKYVEDKKTRILPSFCKEQPDQHLISMPAGPVLETHQCNRHARIYNLSNDRKDNRINIRGGGKLKRTNINYY